MTAGWAARVRRTSASAAAVAVPPAPAVVPATGHQTTILTVMSRLRVTPLPPATEHARRPRRPRGVMPTSAIASAAGADSPKRSTRHDRAVQPGPLGPPEGARGLDGDPGGQPAGQHLVAVAGVLRAEELERRHADHAGRDPLAGQDLARRHRGAHLGAGPDQDAVVAVGEHVGAALDGRRALERRQALTAQHQRRRPVGACDGDPPRLGRLGRVGRPDRHEVGDRPQRREVLDRLVRRAVLPEARSSRA